MLMQMTSKTTRKISISWAQFRENIGRRVSFQIISGPQMHMPFKNVIGIFRECGHIGEGTPKVLQQKHVNRIC